jgi:hypothetical protein
MIGRMVSIAVVAWAAGAVVPGAAARSIDASAAVVDTRYGVIASTQGSTPDTAEAFIREYEQRRARYGAPIGIRLFSARQLPLAGDGTVAGRLLTWAARRHPEELVTVSHKVRDDARLRRLLDWVHSRRLRVSVIYFHEVQDNWFGRRPGQGDPAARPQVYRAVYRAYRAVISAHPARARVSLEKNLMWFWQHYRAATMGGDWHRYVEARDPADVLSWDAYVFPGMPTSQGRYATPDEFFRYARDAWLQYRIPWGVGEIGTAVQDGRGVGVERDWDPIGVRFTAWVDRITAAAANPASIDRSYATLPPARFMKWWDGLDASNVDLGLQQVPAAATRYGRLVRASSL